MAKNIEKPDLGKDKTVHVIIGKTDFEITEVRKKEFSATGHALSRDEIAAKSTPEPFGV